MKDDKTLGYAKAIFEIAKGENSLPQVSDELFRVARAVESNNELRQALTDIAVPAAGKEKLLSDILDNKVSPHTLGILKFVVAQGQSRKLIEISDELARLAESESKREIAEVRTAVKLDADQEARLAKALSAATGKEVTVKVIIDPKIIGGVVARVGDVVIDGSVKHKLDILKENFGPRRS